MWVFAKRGFVSIAQALGDGDGTLTVRGRVRADLEHFRSRCEEHLTGVTDRTPLPPGALGPITEDHRADYRFRFRVARYAIASVLADEVRAITYHNFKGAVLLAAANRTEAGRWRGAVYHDVWHAAQGLERIAEGYLERRRDAGDYESLPADPDAAAAPEPMPSPARLPPHDTERSA